MAADTTQDQQMPDERFARQLARFLKRQRHEAKANQQDNVNKDLAPIEGAFQQMRLYEVRRSIAMEEISRLARTIAEAEEQHVSFTRELQKWQLTFEGQLNVQKVDLSSRLHATMRRNAELMAAHAQSADASTAEEKFGAEQVAIAQQIGELKLKLSRMKSLMAWKSDEKVEITIHPPAMLDDMAFLQTPSPELVREMVCANDKCGRVKVNRVHPLCRNCQKLYAEGKISGEWTGIIAALEAED